MNYSAAPAARLATNMSGKNNFGSGFGKFDMDKKAAMLASAWQVTQDQQRRRREEQARSSFSTQQQFFGKQAASAIGATASAAKAAKDSKSGSSWKG